jgi:hypothetical protein
MKRIGGFWRSWFEAIGLAKTKEEKLLVVMFGWFWALVAQEEQDVEKGDLPQDPGQDREGQKEDEGGNKGKKEP